MAIEAALRLENVTVKQISLKDVFIKSALIIPSDNLGIEVLLEMRPIITSSKSQSNTAYEFTVVSYDRNDNCIEHCRGVILVERGSASPVSSITPKPNLANTLKNTDHSIHVNSFYRHLSSIGFEYGAKFRLLKDCLGSGPGVSISPLVFDANVLPSNTTNATVMHPTLLDSTFHIVFNAIESCLGRSLNEPYVPTFLRIHNISGLFSQYATEKTVQKYLVGSFTKLPSTRVALSDVILQDEEGKLMINIEGLEVTSLGREEEQNSERTLFFHQRWLPCFDLLKSYPALASKLIAELVDIYAHQYPNSRLLHITNNIEDTKNLISCLGAFKRQRRRFKSIDVKAAVDGEELSKMTNGLVQMTEPNGTYDLVIAEKVDPVLVADGGFAIASQAPVGFECVWSGRVSAYRRPVAPTPVGKVTVVMPRKPSDRTKAVLAALEAIFIVANITTIQNCVTETENVFVLMSFDEDIQDTPTFRGVQKLLGGASKKITWLLEGATMEAVRPENAMVQGLIRTARSENDQFRITLMDFGTDSPATLVAETLKKVLEADMKEDELAERSGCVYIPKVEADDSRNCKLHNGPNKEPRLEPFGEGRPLKLKVGKIGLLETLHFAEDEEIVDMELAPDEIELEVKASVINFHDIVIAMVIIDDYKLGDECAGVVTKIGSQVEGFVPGDRVIAARPGQGAHRGIVRNPACYCYKLQGDMSFADATAMP